MTRETLTIPFTEPAVDDCRPGLAGTVTRTDVVGVHSVETANGFHLKGTSTGTGRIAWDDGTYTLISWKTEFTFQAPREGTTTYKETHKDYGHTYSADGTFPFRTTFHLVEKIAVVDGVVRLDFNKGNLRIYGSC